MNVWGLCHKELKNPNYGIFSKKKNLPEFGHKVLWPESPLGFIYPHFRFTECVQKGHNPNTCQQGGWRNPCTTESGYSELSLVTWLLCTWCCLHRKPRTLEPIFTRWAGWRTSSERASLHATSGPLQISLNHPLQKDLGCLTSSLFGEPWAAYHHCTHMFRGEPSTGTLSMRSSSVGIPRPWSSHSHPVSSYGETEHNCWNPFWIKSCPEVKRAIKWVGALSPRIKWLQEANSPQFHLLQVVQSLGLPIIF